MTTFSDRPRGGYRTNATRPVDEDAELTGTTVDHAEAVKTGKKKLPDVEAIRQGVVDGLLNPPEYKDNPKKLWPEPTWAHAVQTGALQLAYARHPVFTDTGKMLRYGPPQPPLMVLVATDALPHGASLKRWFEVAETVKGALKNKDYELVLRTITPGTAPDANLVLLT
jgi:hypothetical protein